MKIVTFSEGQSGEEWLAWRRNGIGASDISVIMGSNPYSTPYQLWEKKCGYRAEDVMNDAMKHGVAHEETARQWVNSQLKVNLKPLCIEDIEAPYMRASLDGYDENEGILCEIKCPVSTQVLDAALKSQSVPSYWADQVQWQIMLSGAQRSVLAMWDYRTQSCILIEMYAEKSRIEEMREKAKEFWKGVALGRPPPTDKRDYVEVNDEELRPLLLEYERLGKEEKAISTIRKDLKQRIEEFGDDGNFRAFGFKIQRVIPAPRYDVDEMKKDGIDIDRYIKKSDTIGWYRIYPPSAKPKW